MSPKADTGVEVSPFFCHAAVSALRMRLPPTLLSSRRAAPEEAQRTSYPMPLIFPKGIRAHLTAERLEYIKSHFKGYSVKDR